MSDILLLPDIQCEQLSASYDPTVELAESGSSFGEPGVTLGADGIAHLNIVGALTSDTSRFGRFIASIFGGTSTVQLIDDLQTLATNPRLRGMVMNISSPGGHAAHIETAAGLVRAIAKKVPVVAFVPDMAASAAYWIASAATTIVGTRSSIYGSLGAKLMVREPDASRGKMHVIVSSQSPKKVADPASAEGRNQLQAFADSLAQVFLQDVATYRGVSLEKVLSDFGQGDLVVGEAAVQAGMADSSTITTETEAVSLLLSLVSARQTAEHGIKMGGSMDEAKLKLEGATAERTRMLSILNSPEAVGRSKMALTLAGTPDMTLETANSILAQVAKESPLLAAMAAVANPTVVTSEAATEEVASGTLLQAAVKAGLTTTIKQ